MASIKYEAAAITSLMTTELNSLANGSGIDASAGYDNGSNLYLFGYFELNVTFGSAPTAGQLIDLYLMAAPDGTNYDTYVTGASEYAPIAAYVGSFQLQAITSAQKCPLGGPAEPRLVPLPPVPFKAFVINNSGQAFPASGSTLKMVPYRYQSV